MVIRIYIILVLAGILDQSALGQKRPCDCYQNFLAEGLRLQRQGDYPKAIRQFTAAKSCCDSKTDTLQFLLDKEIENTFSLWVDHERVGNAKVVLYSLQEKLAKAQQLYQEGNTDFSYEYAREILHEDTLYKQGLGKELPSKELRAVIADVDSTAISARRYIDSNDFYRQLNYDQVVYDDPSSIVAINRQGRWIDLYSRQTLRIVDSFQVPGSLSISSYETDNGVILIRTEEDRPQGPQESLDGVKRPAIEERTHLRYYLVLARDGHFSRPCIVDMAPNYDSAGFFHLPLLYPIHRGSLVKVLIRNGRALIIADVNHATLDSITLPIIPDWPDVVVKRSRVIVDRRDSNCFSIIDFSGENAFANSISVKGIPDRKREQRMGDATVVGGKLFVLLDSLAQRVDTLKDDWEVRRLKKISSLYIYDLPAGSLDTVIGGIDREEELHVAHYQPATSGTSLADRGASPRTPNVKILDIHPFAVLQETGRLIWVKDNNFLTCYSPFDRSFSEIGRRMPFETMVQRYISSIIRNQSATGSKTNSGGNFRFPFCQQTSRMYIEQDTSATRFLNSVSGKEVGFKGIGSPIQFYSYPSINYQLFRDNERENSPDLLTISNYFVDSFYYYFPRHDTVILRCNRSKGVSKYVFSADSSRFGYTLENNTARIVGLDREKPFLDSISLDSIAPAREYSVEQFEIQGDHVIYGLEHFMGGGNYMHVIGIYSFAKAGFVRIYKIRSKSRTCLMENSLLRLNNGYNISNRFTALYNAGEKIHSLDAFFDYHPRPYD